MLGEDRYRTAAQRIGEFLSRVQNPDGSYPQVVYAGGARAEGPRWLAGTAEVLRAQMLLGRTVPAVVQHRLLAGQLPTGGFRTGEGFSGASGVDFRDVTPAVGWNDKVLRWLAESGVVPAAPPPPTVRPASMLVTVRGRPAIWRETSEAITMVSGGADRALWYRWNKREPWASGVWEVLAG